MKKFFTLFAAVVCGLAVNAKTIYLNGGGSGLWNQANPVFFVHAWASPEANEDVQMSQVSGDIYSADINDAYNNIIFLREATGSTSVIWEGPVGVERMVLGLCMVMSRVPVRNRNRKVSMTSI